MKEFCIFLGYFVMWCFVRKKDGGMVCNIVENGSVLWFLLNFFILDKGYGKKFIYIGLVVKDIWWSVFV